jgi:hypothetical protein
LNEAGKPGTTRQIVESDGMQQGLNAAAQEGGNNPADNENGGKTDDSRDGREEGVKRACQSRSVIKVTHWITNQKVRPSVTGR